MPRSEIAQAHVIVAAMTDLLELAHEADQDELRIPIYADDATFRLAHPQAESMDNALHARIARTTARAAHRIGHDIAVLRLRAAPLQAWLDANPDATPDAYSGEPADLLTGEAALKALGLAAAELKEVPRKPAQGRTLAARIARWATDPDADDAMIDQLSEELLSQRLDGALPVVEKMLEPEDYAYTRQEIDLAASVAVVGERGREREAVLFVSPLLRDGDAPRPPEVPATLQERLTGIALDASFVELILAPFWVPTAALARLKPSELRDVAEALANGIEPTIPRAAPADRDVCLLGLTFPMPDTLDADEEDADAAIDRLDAWLAVVADAAGGGRAEPPLSLARALDLLRRVKLAVPDEPDDEEEDDDAEEEDEEFEVSEALVEALVAHVAGIGTGDALLAGHGDGVVPIRIADGTPDIDADALHIAIADGLSGNGVLFVVPAARPGTPARGHAFLLQNGEAMGLSAADAASAFEDEAPDDWVPAPTAWADAPALDYDPGMP